MTRAFHGDIEELARTGSLKEKPKALQAAPHGTRSGLSCAISFWSSENVLLLFLQNKQVNTKLCLG